MSNGSGSGYPYNNPDLVWSKRDMAPDQEAAALAAAIRQGAPLPPGTFSFKRIDRFSYTAPPTTGQIFQIFTVGADLRGGWITGLGIGSPQFDWFGSNEYYFTINNAQPYEYQLAGSGGPSGLAGSAYAFAPVGTLREPERVHITVTSGDVFGLAIRPQATPAAATVQYNIHVLTMGFFYK